LVARKISLLAIVDDQGFEGALAFLKSPALMVAAAKEAEAFVASAIAAVKSAPDNPYGDDDEAIAGEILRKIEAKKEG
jgi:hypothetical protein